MSSQNGQKPIELQGRFAPEFFGPGGTRYTLIGTGPLGRVGVGNIEHEGHDRGTCRIRVEPSSDNYVDAVGQGLAELEMEDLGWRQPTPENRRFSAIVAEDKLERVLEHAVQVVSQPAEPVTLLTVMRKLEGMQAMITAAYADADRQLEELADQIHAERSRLGNGYKGLAEQIGKITEDLDTVGQNLFGNLAGGRAEAERGIPVLVAVMV